MARFSLNRAKKSTTGTSSVKSVGAYIAERNSVGKGGDDASSYCTDGRDDNATQATRESTSSRGQSPPTPRDTPPPKANAPRSPKSPKVVLPKVKTPRKSSKSRGAGNSEKESKEVVAKSVVPTDEAQPARQSKGGVAKKTNKKKSRSAESPPAAEEKPRAADSGKKKSTGKHGKRSSRSPVIEPDTSLSGDEISFEVSDGGETSYETDGASTSYEGSETSGDNGSFTEGETYTYDSYESNSKGRKFDRKENTKAMKKSAMERNAVVDPTHQAAIIISEHGSLEKLQIQELGYVPKISSVEEVVVKIEVSTISLQDCMIRRGKWYDMKALPYIPGTDIVGTVHQVGEKGLGFGYREGDRVAAVVKGGGNAKYITLNYLEIIKVPKDLDLVDALCLSSTYVPAKEALDIGRKCNTPLTGANILIIGGNGPSGLAAIDLAKLEGANIYATADERHHSYLKELGATCFPIDPMTWLHKLKGKMDIVIDSVCLDEYQSSSLALNEEGTLICTGMSAVYTQGKIKNIVLEDARDFKAMVVKLKAKYFLSNAVYYDRTERFDDFTREYEQQFKYLCHLKTKDLVKPVVAGSSTLNMVACTHKAIEHGETPYGVSVCTPWVTNKST